MGYRLGQSRTFYWKRRCVRSRPHVKATVQVQLREHGWFDVTAIEETAINSSVMLRGVRQLKQWEAFAFCK